ncbi:hypothetical protein [Acidipila rosea]|uniref:DUF5666 domain-containing protein n=1 Tax=Acidipila rosea TaxID=768535 RepID=A0A4R1LC36_9BACT|nr:hypothetical protein [Acidipila rosea]MBW4025855.1 hypothetical protein [Acidobacteriota bacterium]MBW4044226.1 hypothetical protein [Acidobacteriota bacterium]TCK75744.1 hypothetical protein C7378_0735 [Acidipila rosea]
MKKLTTTLAILLMASPALFAADMSYTGVVSDSMCGAKHSTASADAAKCVKKCAMGGSDLALVSNGKVYTLKGNKDKMMAYAGKDVKVMGTADGDTINVTSIKAAK